MQIIPEELKQYMNNINIKPEEFTSQEKLVLNKIIAEIEKSGHSKLLTDLYHEDYDEIPVSPKQFYTDDTYLGLSTNQGNGIHPGWRNFLYNELFDNSKQYIEVIFTGAIGTGKSTVACFGLDYIIYKLLCLKNPAMFYNLLPGSKPGIALFNLTLDKGMGVAFYKINQALLNSPWFMRNGQTVGNSDLRKVFIPDKDVTIAVGSTANHFIGLDSFAALLDEMSFTDNKELDMKKMKVYDILTNITRRIVSRFQDTGLVPGKTFLVSSTKHEDDFLSQYRTMKQDDPHTIIVDRPLYEVVSQDRYSGEKFTLAVGNKNTNAFIIDKSEAEQYEQDDYSIYYVPIEHKKEFESDMEGAIRDILGKPQKTESRFLPEERVIEAVTDSFKNILDNYDIRLGFRDSTTIEQHLVLKNINAKLIKYPMFVHHDLSLTGDHTGVAIYAVAHDLALDNLEKDELASWKFIPIMLADISPLRRGEQVPFYKIREFVIKLKEEYGFNILGCSCDGYQSADMLQQYALHNIDAYLISMDRSPCTGYQFFRTALIEHRVFLLDYPKLKSELIHLLENRQTQKVDHPTMISSDVEGSKDVSDACAGAIYCAVEFHKKNALKRKIFDGGSYLFSDIIDRVNLPKDKQYIDNNIDIKKETDDILKDMQRNLFNNMQGLNDDFMF